MTKRLTIIYFISVLFILNGCVGKKKSENVQAIPVRTLITYLDKNRSVQKYVGVVEEERTSVISFPVAGIVDAMYAVEGQHINKGALLAELDTSNLASAYVAAKAQLTQAEDAMRRVQMMYDSKSVAEIKYVEVQTQLEKARSMEAIAKKNLTDSRLKAPFSGVIGKKSVESGENVLPNQPVYTLLKIDDVKVKVAIPEKEIRTILKEQHATLSVPALDDAVYEGVIEETGVMADPISHSYTVRIRVANPDGTLLPGMVCNARIEPAADDNGKSIVLPSKCVQRNGAETFVWLVVNDAPVRRKVQVGRIFPSGVEIISGLESGEEVVTDGYQHIYEGAMIKKMN